MLRLGLLALFCCLSGVAELFVEVGKLIAEACRLVMQLCGLLSGIQGAQSGLAGFSRRALSSGLRFSAQLLQKPDSLDELVALLRIQFLTPF